MKYGLTPRVDLYVGLASFSLVKDSDRPLKVDAESKLRNLSKGFPILISIVWESLWLSVIILFLPGPRAIFRSPIIKPIWARLPAFVRFKLKLFSKKNTLDQED
jgi:hypothetical protein